MNDSRWPFGSKPLKIVICYRREDTVDSTGRLHKDLKLHFNRPFRNHLKRRVVLVRDFDNIPAAVDYESYIKKEIETSVAILAVIGNDWLRVTNPQTGQRRIDDPDDSLRKELTTALSLSKPIIPVLMEKARMPGKEALPDALKDLATMNAREVYDPEWDAGVERLINDLETILRKSGWVSIGGAAVALGALALFLFGAASVISKLPLLLGGTAVSVGQVNAPPATPHPTHTPKPTPTSISIQPGPTVIPTPVAPVTLVTPPPPPPTPAPAVVESVVGTQWEFKSESNVRYIWDFHPGGRLRSRYPDRGTYLPDGTWEQNGDAIIIQTSITTDNPETYRGKIQGDRMEGTYIALEEYRWSAKRKTHGQ